MEIPDGSNTNYKKFLECNYKSQGWFTNGAGFNYEKISSVLSTFYNKKEIENLFGTCGPENNNLLRLVNRQNDQDLIYNFAKCFITISKSRK